MNKLLLLVFYSIAVLQSCDNGSCAKNEKLYITNNSTLRVLFSIREDYLDTIIKKIPNNNISGFIDSNSKIEKGIGLGFCWDRFLPYGKSTWIYFFDNDSIQMLSWDTVAKTKRGYLGRKVINRDSLNQTNWTISNP